VAGVPCFNDTCGTIATVNAGRVEINVRLNPAGGLVCTEGAGLGLSAQSLNDMVTAGMTTREDLPSPGNYAFIFGINNLTALTVLITADFRFSFIYTATGVGLTLADRYFVSDLTHQVDVDSASVLAGGAFSNTIQSIAPPTGSGERQYTAKSAGVFQISPGSHTVIMTTTRNSPGSDSVGTQAGTGGNNGIRMDARLGVIGLPNGNIAS